MASLPPLAAFPSGTWRQHLKGDEWNGLLVAWTALCQAYAGLQDDELKRRLAKDESITTFLTSFMEQTATDGTAILEEHAVSLMRAVFQLTARVIGLKPPAELLTFDFIANVSRLYPKRITAPLLARLFSREDASLKIETSLSALKKLLIPHLDSGIRGDLKLVEQRLTRLNPLLHASPYACSFFLAGSDFLDSLIAGFKVMNPPLRKVIVTTLYLCLIGLVEAEPSPRWAMLSDQLYALRLAADTHKAGPLNVNDSLVPELVTSTPILRVLLRKAETSEASTDNLKKRITALESFKKGPMVRPKRLIKRKVDKGKGKASHEEADAEMHIHKMSKITQVQDVLGDLNLGAGFIAKCLDEYDDDVAQVIDRLLGDSLPAHLAQADRQESLYEPRTTRIDSNAQTKATDPSTDQCSSPKSIRTLRRDQRHPHNHSYQRGKTPLTMMSLISLPWMCPKSRLESAGQKQRTSFSKTRRRRLAKPPFSRHSPRSTRMTMSAMTRTMLRMLVARSTPRTKRPML